MLSILRSLSTSPFHSQNPFHSENNITTAGRLSKPSNKGQAPGNEPYKNALLLYGGMAGVSCFEQLVRGPLSAAASVQTLSTGSFSSIVKELLNDTTKMYGNHVAFGITLTTRIFQRTGIFEANDYLKKQDNINPFLRLGGITVLETIFLSGSESIQASVPFGKKPSLDQFLRPRGLMAMFGRNLFFNAVGLGIEVKNPMERLAVSAAACVVSQPFEVLRYLKTEAKNPSNPEKPITYCQALNILTNGGTIQTDNATVNLRPLTSFFRAGLTRIASVGVGFLISSTGWAMLREKSNA